jgi:peptide/nickel transport system permease protein
MNVIPGDPVSIMMEKRADAETIAKIRHELGTDLPLTTQYVNMVKKAFRGDLGKSFFSGIPVSDLIAQKFRTTLKLAQMAYIFALTIGILSGIFAALHRGKIGDTAVMIMAMLGISAPVFWIALILQIVFGLMLNWLPISGFSSPIHWILPTITLGAANASYIARITRTSMLEVMKQDYIRTARAKGVYEKRVIFKHMLKNALLPIITISGTQLGGLLTGAIMTETVFSISGLGRLTVDSIFRRDFPVIQGAVLFIAVVYVAVNLIVDISYALVDPRISLSEVD